MATQNKKTTRGRRIIDSPEHDDEEANGEYSPKSKRNKEDPIHTESSSRHEEETEDNPYSHKTFQIGNVEEKEQQNAIL